MSHIQRNSSKTNLSFSNSPEPQEKEVQSSEILDSNQRLLENPQEVHEIPPDGVQEQDEDTSLSSSLTSSSPQEEREGEEEEHLFISASRLFSMLNDFAEGREVNVANLPPELVNFLRMFGTLSRTFQNIFEINGSNPNETSNDQSEEQETTTQEVSSTTQEESPFIQENLLANGNEYFSVVQLELDVENRDSEENQPSRRIILNIVLNSDDEEFEESVLDHLFQVADSQGFPPASPNILDKLPTKGVTNDLLEKESSCSICFEDYSPKDTVVQLPCGHFEHRDCGMKWWNIHNTCPVCRYELPVEDENYEIERAQRMKQRGIDEDQFFNSTSN